MPADLSRREMIALAGPAALLGMGLAASARADDHAAHGDADASSAVLAAFKAAHDGNQYTLPPLPYAYDALEPHIDAQTMRLHHSKHHQGYVNGLNKTLQSLTDLAGGDAPDGNALYALQRNLSFNGGGHVLHTLFWSTMSPDGGGHPTGPIADKINAQFGSFDAFKAYFKAAATGVKGSGWAVLAHEPIGQNLVVFSLNDQDTKMIAGAIPLLPIDVWEHAYYLNYQNRRADYVDAWFNLIHWDAVNALYGMHARPHYG
jgi:Fe-Mn family superoxide dismutase